MADQTTQLHPEDTIRSAPGTPDSKWAYRLGFWSALATTAVGALYFMVILTALLTGNFTFPPSLPLQLFGGVISLLTPPLLVLLVASLHTITPAPKVELVPRPGAAGGLLSPG